MKKIDWLTSYKLLIGIGVLIFSVYILLNIEDNKLKWRDWTGFGEDVELSRTVERKPNRQVTKRTVVRKFESEKTLWDWLSVLVVPASLAGLGIWFQHLQQERIGKRENFEKDMAEDNQREEVVQTYLDRMSELLIGQKLLTLVENDPALDVARARTLSIFRRLKNDADRKGSVVQFLYDTDLIKKLDLKKADLSYANLVKANLSGAKLSGAILENTNLAGATLSETDFRKANLKRADLSQAILHDAKFDEADLIGTRLMGADLHGTSFRNANLLNADLRSVKNLNKTELDMAKLCKTSLPAEYNNLADRDCEILGILDS